MFVLFFYLVEDRVGKVNRSIRGKSVHGKEMRLEIVVLPSISLKFYKMLNQM